MKISTLLIYTIGTCFLFITGASCINNSGPQEDDELYYFPDKNVYYDVRKAHYYYSLDGLKTWDSLAFNGTDYGKALGIRIPVQRPGEQAWANNDSLRKVHNGVVLNMVNGRTLWIQKRDSLKNIKPVVVSKARPEVVEDEPEEAPKKGLKKFFNKIFGKKKPTNE